MVDLLTYSYLESNRPNLILIDEAHVLTSTCLNELRLLTNATGKNEAVITLVLLGQPSGYHLEITCTDSPGPKNWRLD